MKLSETINYKTCQDNFNRQQVPKKILIIRLQAMGDVIITLPYIASLRKKFGEGIQIDFLTRQETFEIPSKSQIFNKVYALKGQRNNKKQWFFTLKILPILFYNHYDIVIDLQRNKISKFIRKVLFPKAWSEFDRFSHISAAERNRLTINAVLPKKYQIVQFEPFTLKLTPKENEIVEKKVVDLLLKNGWNGKNKLIVLNPAGAFANRNWEIEKYIGFANLWLKKFPKTQFLILGIGKISEKAGFLKQHLQEKLISLTEKTNPFEAYYILKKVQLVLTEDSGLMHFSWTQGIPTVALMGASRSFWSNPQGENSIALDSSDMVCGNCYLEKCKFNNLPCLTRYTPEFVMKKCTEVLTKSLLNI
jgi:heptosyltransferase II